MAECSTVSRGANRRHRNNHSRRERGGVMGFRQNDSVIPLAARLLADLGTYAAADGRDEPNN